MKLILLVILTISLHSKIVDVRTDHLIGKVYIEKRDIVILRPMHPLIKRLRNAKIIKCDTIKCREETIEKLQHKFRTNGISVIKIY